MVFTTQIVRWIKSILFICFQHEKRNPLFLRWLLQCFGRNVPLKYYLLCALEHIIALVSGKSNMYVHAQVLTHVLLAPPRSQHTIKCRPHNSATFSVGFYQYLLPVGLRASCEATQASNQNPLHSDSDSNTIQFPDHGKGFSLNSPVVNLEL